MRKLIERKSGDERTLALAQDYFYLAQYHLGRGQTAKARKLLKDTRRRNVIIYVEHTAAASNCSGSAGRPTRERFLRHPLPDRPCDHLTRQPAARQRHRRRPVRKGSRNKVPERWNQELCKQ
jgi:hypothetical protein